MPILRCPECDLVIAWRGKALSVKCPGDHDRQVWAGRAWRDDPEMLHVDRDGIRRNGHAIDAHLPPLEADARAEDVEAGRELVATNLSKAG